MVPILMEFLILLQEYQHFFSINPRLQQSRRTSKILKNITHQMHTKQYHFLIDNVAVLGQTCGTPLWASPAPRRHMNLSAVSRPEPNRTEPNYTKRCSFGVVYFQFGWFQFARPASEILIFQLEKHTFSNPRYETITILQGAVAFFVTLISF